MKVVNDILAQIDQCEAELGEVSKPTMARYATLKKELQAAYNAEFEADDVLQADLLAVQSSKDLTCTTHDEWLSQWIRCNCELPKDVGAREALVAYLDERYIQVDFENDCFTYSIGPCILINDDGSVYDQDSGKFIFKTGAYESNEDRDAGIEAWMTKHGYFPSVVLATIHNDYMYIDTKPRETK